MRLSGLPMPPLLLAACAAAIALPSVAQSSPDARDDIAGPLSAAISRCWLPPAVDGRTPPVKVRMTLDTDGTLAGTPEIIDPSQDDLSRAAEAAAIRALLRCAPYTQAAALLDGATVIVVNFSLEGFSVGSEEIESAGASLTEMTGLPGIILRMPVPDGLCYVDPQRSRTEADYARLMSEAMPDNMALGFFLECRTVEQLASGNEDFDLPRSYVVLTTPTSADGEPLRAPGRSLAAALTAYERLFQGAGVASSPLESEFRDIEAQLESQFGVAVRAGALEVARKDDLAIYTTSSPEAVTAEGTQRSTAIGAFTQIFDVPLTISFYTGYDPDAVPALVDEMADLVEALHDSSTLE